MLCPSRLESFLFPIAPDPDCVIPPSCSLLRALVLASFPVSPQFWAHANHGRQQRRESMFESSASDRRAPSLISLLPRFSCFPPFVAGRVLHGAFHRLSKDEAPSPREQYLIAEPIIPPCPSLPLPSLLFFISRRQTSPSLILASYPSSSLRPCQCLFPSDLSVP